MVKKEFLNIPMVMLSMGISSTALLLYGLIYKMSYTGWECFPTNKTLANTLKITPRNVNLLLNELLTKGAISIRVDEQNRNIRWIKPLITNEVPIKSSHTSNTGGFEELQPSESLYKYYIQAHAHKLTHMRRVSISVDESTYTKFEYVSVLLGISIEEYLTNALITPQFLEILDVLFSVAIKYANGEDVRQALNEVLSRLNCKYKQCSM